MEKESKAAAGKSPAALAGSELWEGPAGDFVARAPIYGDILARLGARDGVHGDPCDWPDTLPVWRVQGSSPIVAMIRATDPRRAAAIFAHRYGSRPDYVGRREVLGECADTGVPILAGDHLAWTPTDGISRCTLELEAVKPDGASFPYGPSGPEPVGDGSRWVVADILFRMLQPEELAAAHSFPADYDWSPARTKTNRVRLVGNSWPVRMGQALCRSILENQR